LIETAGQICPSEDIAAYLDSELDAGATNRFEEHVAHCETCSTELRRQRQLVCTLDAAFGSQRKFDLPNDFTRLIATRAESDLRGVRSKAERYRAAKLCAVLGLIAFAILGAASSSAVLQPLRNALRLSARLLDLVWQAAADATESLAIILRVLTGGMTGNPYVWPLLIGLTLIVAVTLLARLIGKYHRRQIIE
jgi:anti-sigma factor RsiW